MAGPPPDTGTPRWVKVSGIIALVVVLLVVVGMLIGGEHGPGRHTPFGNAGGQTPPSSAIEDYTPPEGDYG
jgi:hypothetical protein